jgi:hypothetical protein
MVAAVCRKQRSLYVGCWDAATIIKQVRCTARSLEKREGVSMNFKDQEVRSAGQVLNLTDSRRGGGCQRKTVAAKSSGKRIQLLNQHMAEERGDTDVEVDDTEQEM